MALKVVPTKGNLIAMKKSLQLANLGYNGSKTKCFNKRNDDFIR